MTCSCAGLHAAVLGVCLAFSLASSATGTTAPEQLDDLVLPEVLAAPFRGDLPAIRERGILRALVSFSRTDFFLEGARPRGIHVEMLEILRQRLNQKIKPGELSLAIKYVVVPFNELIPALLEGRGDIAVGNLTLTPERRALVDFAAGARGRVDELLVTHVDVDSIQDLEDLAGRTVHVLAGSSYAEHLRRLDTRLRAQGLAPVDVREAEPELATEDLLEMVNAGVIPLTVADDYRAELWARVLPRIRVREDIPVNVGGTIGWAIRKSNPELLARVRQVTEQLSQGTLIGNTLLERYYGNTHWITNPLAAAEHRKLERMSDLFREYGARYGFDWLALAAQGYQESQLDQTRKSPAGALGVMQILPSTASDPNVDIEGIERLEPNIHAGTRYLAFLRDRYFANAELRESDRLAFSWAAYNVGPARVRLMRAHAAELGFNPDRWFGHVEHAALALVGREPVRYVRNVYKYYVTYRMVGELREEGNGVVEALEQSD